MIEYRRKYKAKIYCGKFLWDDLNSFKQHVRELEGKKVVFTLEEEQVKVTPNMRKYYWKVVVSTLAEATGEIADRVHAGLKKKYLPQILKVNDEGERIYLDSTTKLTNKQFVRYCNLIRVGEADIAYIAEPNEVDYD